MPTSKNRLDFVARHWFLLGLGLVLLVGLLGSDKLAGLNHFALPKTLLVCVVMGLMALPIPFELIRRSLARPWPAILASLINMGGIPALSWLAATSLSASLGGGLIVAATIPCTLASAAVWTRRAGGDDTVAILVTLITNMACVVVTPLWLVALLGQNVKIEIGPLITELCIVVLLPMAIAQGLRKFRPLAEWAERRKSALGIVCQLGILCMVFLGAIQMGTPVSSNAVRSASEAVVIADRAETGSGLLGYWEIAWTIVLTMAIHLVAMAVGWNLAAGTGVARPQRIGVAIAGSQKTLMIGLKMAMDCGVSILPMVIYHIGQLFLDTIIADRWKDHGKKTVLEGTITSPAAR